MADLWAVCLPPSYMPVCITALIDLNPGHQSYDSDDVDDHDHDNNNKKERLNNNNNSNSNSNNK